MSSEDEAFVRALWPDARFQQGLGPWTLLSLDPDGNVRSVLGTGPTELAAWADAARRIREQEHSS